MAKQYLSRQQNVDQRIMKAVTSHRVAHMEVLRKKEQEFKQRASE